MVQENNIATASVNINVKGSSGKVKSTTNTTSNNDIDDDNKKILKEIKNLGGLFRKSVDFQQKISNATSIFGRLKMSGLGGAGSSGLGGLLSGLGGVGVGLAAGAAGLLSGSTSTSQNEIGYQKVIQDGQEKVVKYNQKTDEIVAILTMQEAENQGILDKQGKIKSNLIISDEYWNNITKNLELQKGQVVITTDTLTQYGDATLRATSLQLEYNEMLEKRNAELRAQGYNVSGFKDTGMGTHGGMSVQDKNNLSVNSPFTNGLGIGKTTVDASSIANAQFLQDRYGEYLNYTRNTMAPDKSVVFLPSVK